jgi:hypothetical protein
MQQAERGWQLEEMPGKIDLTDDGEIGGKSWVF